MIGQPAFDLIGEGFATEPVGEVRLKGKEHVIRIYHVLGRKAGDRGEHREAEQADNDQPVTSGTVEAGVGSVKPARARGQGRYTKGFLSTKPGRSWLTLADVRSLI